MKFPALRLVCTASVLAAALDIPLAAHAQAAPFPSKPVRLVVGAAPGGSTDVIARMIGPHLSQQWAQPVVIENKPGAGGNTAAELVAKSPPDGHTLMMYHDGLATSVSLYKKLPFDPAKDLVPVSSVARSTIVVGVSSAVPVTTLKELIQLAKSKPGSLTYASCGIGTPHHIAGEMFKSMANVDMAHVSYKGCGPAVVDVLGGHVPVFFQTLSNVADHIKNHRIRVLGVAEAERVPEFPDIPTISEAGVPGFKIGAWYGVFAPKGTPKDLVARISADIAKAVATPEMRSSLVHLYYRPETAAPEQFAHSIGEDIRRLGAVIRSAGITAE